MAENIEPEKKLQPGDPGFMRGNRKRTTAYYGLRQSAQATGDQATETAARLEALDAHRGQKNAVAKAAEGNGVVGTFVKFLGF